MAFVFVFLKLKAIGTKTSLQPADLLHDLLVQLVVFESCGSN